MPDHCEIGTPPSPEAAHQQDPMGGDLVVASWSHPAHAGFARMSRHWLASLLQHRWHDEDATYLALQVFAEIIANAVEHSGGPVIVTVTLDGTRLTCGVGDTSTELPAEVVATVDDEHHRGLAMVHALLDRGPLVRKTPDGKLVTFEVTAHTQR